MMRVPQKLLMQPAAAQLDEGYGAAFRALLQREGPLLDERFQLCLFLLLERAKGAASFWAPYIAILPPTYGMEKRGQNGVAGG